MEFEEASHDDSERRMLSLDDLAEVARQITEIAKNFLAKTQALPELNQDFTLQQEREGSEQIKIINETSSPHQTCWEMVVYDESVLIDSSKIPETMRRPVTFHTLSFRYLEKTEVQESLWEEEKKRLNREIERQKQEIKDLKEKFDKMMEMTKKIMDYMSPPRVYVMCLRE
jgi:predicted ribosome quality control (RQC) complex YloA/Tae2 family protein